MVLFVRALFVFVSLLFARPVDTAAQIAGSEQPAIQLDIRSEVARATGGLRDVVGGDPGFGFGIGVRYWPVSWGAVYGGADWFRFSEDRGADHVRFTDAGFRAGIHLMPLRGQERAGPFVYGGLTRTRADLLTRSIDSRRSDDYGWAWGGEVGGGLAVPLSYRLNVVPEVRYRFRDIDASTPGAEFPELSVGYVGLNLGIVWAF